MSKPIVFDGWWSEEEKADCPEPWERFTVMVHGEEARESRKATVDDLLLAGFVPLEMVETTAIAIREQVENNLNVGVGERLGASIAMDSLVDRLRQQMEKSRHAVEQ